jgi:hypothetical protein
MQLISIAAVNMVLVSAEVQMSYVQPYNLLMAMETADHMQTSLVILSQSMAQVKICSLIRRISNLQLPK